MSPCQINNQYPWIECQNPVLDLDPDGLCLLHSRKEDKGQAAFYAEVQAKLDREDYDFRGVFFPGSVSFAKKEFKKDADFSRATFSGVADFRGLRLEKEGRLRFQDMSLAHVLFAGTDLRCLEFHNVTWYRYWWRDAVNDEVILNKEEIARLSQVIKETAYLADVIPWNTEKDEETEEIDPPEYARVEELYRYLKINYEREGDHKKAGDFHYGEMEMHRQASRWRWCPVYWYNLYRVLSGYGERPVRALFCLAGLLFGQTAWAC